MIQLLVGYEFFDSGWNKLFTKDSFVLGMPDALKGMIQGQSGWYVNFVNNVAIPHAALFGYLVEWGEFLAGAGLILAALLFLFRRQEDGLLHRVSSILSIAALAGGVFMALNFYIAGGAPSPFPGLNDPNGEGVTIDIFLPLMSLVLLWWNASGLLAAGKIVLPHSERDKGRMIA
jgi:uncharacterized membrane protein YphA (DoxX/SURF4 family)